MLNDLFSIWLHEWQLQVALSLVNRHTIIACQPGTIVGVPNIPGC